MTTLLGGGPRIKPPVYTGLQVQTSALDLPIAIGWGKNRHSFNVIWFNDFEKHKQSGGKGGGKGGGYDYTAAVILSLGEGVISSIPSVYMNQNTVTTLAKLNLTLFTGTSTQSPWSFVSSKYPSEAISYANTAYLACPKMDLGGSATVPSLAFECVMNLSGTMPGTVDANLYDILPDFLTNTRYGMGLASADVNATDVAACKAYTQAQGLFFSPILERAELATDIINRWAKLSNCWIFWSGNSMRCVPLGDEALSANSATYTPDTTIEYSLTIDDFVDKANPITISRVDPADAYNRTILNCRDRTIQYNVNPVEYKDQTLVDLYGIRDNNDVTSADEICDTSVGQIAATLMGKRAAFVRNTYAFTLPHRFVRLEPGDKVALTHPFISAITNLPVRIRTVDEDDKGDLAIVAEEYSGVVGTFVNNSRQAPSFTPIDQLVDPGNVNDPCVFEPPSSLARSAQIWVSASGGADWGGADVYISLDGGTIYSKVGTITTQAKQGLLTAPLASHADPDIVDTLSVDLTQSQQTLNPVTTADADAFRTLAYLAAPSSAGVIQTSGELVAYGTVTSTGTYTDDITYLRRALYGTSAASHSIGDNFTLLDLTDAIGSMVRYELPSQYIGSTIHVKFVSFNIFGINPQDISTVTDYTYTSTGTGYGSGTGGVPASATGQTLNPTEQFILFLWNQGQATDNITNYSVYRANGSGASFSSATKIADVGTATSYQDSTATPGASYTYWSVPQNVVGSALAGSGVSTTATSFVVNSLQYRGGTPGRAPIAGEELFATLMNSGDALPANPTTWKLACEIAPTANWTLTLKQNTTVIGTGTINAGSTTGAWSFTSGVTFANSDFFRAVCPSVADPTISGVAYTIIGTRTS